MSHLLAPSFYRGPHFLIFSPLCAQSTTFLNEEKPVFVHSLLCVKHPSTYSFIRHLAPTSSKVYTAYYSSDTSECSTIGVFVLNGMSLSCL